VIGFFPTPYPDELLYSICARFNERMRYPNNATTVKELFGSKNAAAIVDLPSRLNILVAQLPNGHLHTADRFINDNTLLPFYVPFIPSERLHKSKEDMCRANSNHVRERLGITASSIQVHRQLRFCPSCVAENRERFGEAYWHRIHQVTGVEVCPYHAVFLELSNALWKNRRSPGQFTSAERTVQTPPARPLNIADAHHSIHLKIASDVAWLLHQNNLNFGSEVLRARYYNLLLQRGYAYYNGRVRSSKLLKDFIDFYSIEFLDGLQCPISATAHNWITRLVLKYNSTVVQHPLRHLLLMTFLGCTAKEFLTSFQEYTPFGKGPWPCFNKASDHYLEPRVTDCQIIDSQVKGKLSRPMGTFRCECGFAYTRMGPDREANDHHRVDSVQDYGAVWAKRLQELWLDPTITLYQMANILGTAQNTVVRRAIYMGLQYPRNTLTQASLSQPVNKRYKIIRRSIPNDLKERRERLSLLIKANPKAGRRELQKTAPYLTQVASY
jgi:hypothetical protein